jgi:DNA ligase-1
LARAIVQTPPLGVAQERPKNKYDMLKVYGQTKFGERVEFVHENISRAYSELPNLDKIVEELLKSEDAADTISEVCKMTPGIPLNPMLAQPTKGVTEVLTRLGSKAFTCEYKYDGERAQIHYFKNTKTGEYETHIYSRNLEDNTSKYPDLIKQLPRCMSEGTVSYIIDCEAVAWDAVEKKLLPFQVLSHRARKSVNIEDVKIKVCLHCFDLLYLNGERLIKKPFIERRTVLRKSFKEIEGEFHFASYIDVDDVSSIYPFLQKAVNEQCEGLMVKTLQEEAQYEPSRRSYNWLKIKKDYMEGMTDTVDLVVVGAWTSKITENMGVAEATETTEARPKEGNQDIIYTHFLLACYDDSSASFHSIAKLRYTPKDDTELTDKLSENTIEGGMDHSCIHCANDEDQPDTFFKPNIVFETKGLDLAFSPNYRAARGKLSESTQGVELRKPVFLRVRDDKPPESATNSAQIVALFQKQSLFGAKSVDLVPIGAYFGTGKRTGTYGGYLLACYDEETESFQAMTKVGTGLTDDVLKSHYEFYSQHTIPEAKSYYQLSSNMESPEVWLDDVQVWEIKGADLTVSPAYAAAQGLIDPRKGVSLRFPRFMGVSIAKEPEQATTANEVANMYRQQALCISSSKSEFY